MVGKDLGGDRLFRRLPTPAPFVGFQIVGVNPSASIRRGGCSPLFTVATMPLDISKIAVDFCTQSIGDSGIPP